MVKSRHVDVAEHFVVLAGVLHFVAGFADFLKTLDFQLFPDTSVVIVVLRVIVVVVAIVAAVLVVVDDDDIVKFLYLLILFQVRWFTYP